LPGSVTQAGESPGIIFPLLLKPVLSLPKEGLGGFFLWLLKIVSLSPHGERIKVRGGVMSS